MYESTDKKSSDIKIHLDELCTVLNDYTGNLSACHVYWLKNSGLKTDVTLHYPHVSWNFPFRCLDLLALEAGLFNPTLLTQILSYDTKSTSQ